MQTQPDRLPEPAQRVHQPARHPAAHAAAQQADQQVQRRSRDRALRKSAWSGIAGRGLALALGLATVPLAIRGLGAERYGIWLTISAALAFLRVSDLGVANGLVTEIGRALGQPDADATIRRWLSSALVVVAASALLLWVAGGSLMPVAPWRAWLRVSPSVSNSELLGALAVAGTALAASLPLGLVEKFYQGLQRGYLHNYFAVFGNLCAAATLAAAVHWSPNLFTLALALAACPALAQLGAGVYAFAFRWPHLRPRWSSVRRSKLRALTRTGGLFVVIQMAALGVWQTDRLVINHLLGPSAVSRYAVSFQLASTYVGLIALWLAPLWPALAEAIGRRDHAWVRATLQRNYLRAMSLALVGAAGLIALGRPVVRIWAGATVEPSLALLGSIGLYMPVFVLCTLNTTALNACGKIRGLALYGISAAVANLILSLWLGARLGLVGVSLATSIASAIPALLSGRDLHREIQTHRRNEESPQQAC